MPDDSASPERAFYRRVPPNRWKSDQRQIPDETALNLRPNEAGLSVFDAGEVSGEYALQHQIDLWTQFAAKGNLKAAASLAACGGSVEGMLDMGWGVVKTPESTYTNRGFTPDTETDRFGHLEIKGTADDFQKFAREIIDESQVVLFKRSS